MASTYDKASLVMIPSGTKASKIFSQKPVNGDGDFTFSRSTAATRINADGNIEKETQNLLLQSNTFDTTWGIVGAASVTGGQAGYDGTNNAWLLSKTAAWSNVSQSIANSGLKTFSVYVKANASNWGLLVLSTGATDPVAYYDLANGVVGVNASNIDAVITPVSGGWYRISIVASQTINAVRIYPAEANTSSGSSGSIYIQDAQLEQGLVARDVITTTTAAVEGGITDNVPRLDYTDSSCPALLLEPQRTNLVPISEGVPEDFGGVTLTENYGTSPEGVQNSLKVQKGGSSENERIEVIDGGNVTLVSGRDYTISAFVKNIDVTGITTISCRVISGTLFRQGYQWNGSSLSVTSSNSNGTRTNVLTEDYGNGWWRIGFSFEADGTSGNFEIDIDREDRYDTTSIETWGWQLESATGGASYATSYIPTYGTSVTRNGDTNTITNALTSISGVNGLSLFFEVDAAVISGAVRYSLLQTISGSAEWVFLSYESSSSIRGYIRSNSSTSWDFSWNGIPTTGTIKVLLTMTNGGDGKLYGNGQLRVSNGGVVLSQTLDSVALGGTTGVAESQQYLKQFMVFPTALSNEEAIALTTI